MVSDFDPAQIIDDGKPLFLDVEDQPQDDAQPIVEQPPEDESQYLIQIDRRQLDEQLRTLLQNDPEVRNIFNREVGNKAAARYKPEIAKYQQDLNTYRMLLRREQFAKLPQEEVNKRFESDPNFARAYAEVQHFSAEEPASPDVLSPVDQAAAAEAVRTVVSGGLERGLTQEDLQDIARGLQTNRYDVDETGAPIPASQWREAIGNLQRDVENRLRSKTASPVEAPPQQVKTDTAVPDMAPSGNRGTRVNSISMQQFKALPWEEQFEFLGNGSVERAVEQGRIVLDSGS